MTRIVTTHYRYKRSPRMRPKAAALAGPAIVATKKSRRPAGEGARAAAEAGSSITPPDQDGAAQPSTPRDAERYITATTQSDHPNCGHG